LGRIAIESIKNSIGHPVGIREISGAEAAYSDSPFAKVALKATWKFT